MNYYPPCLGSRKEKDLFEGTLWEAGNGQGILKNELEMRNCPISPELSKGTGKCCRDTTEIAFQIDTRELSSIPPNYYI